MNERIEIEVARIINNVLKKYDYIKTIISVSSNDFQYNNNQNYLTWKKNVVTEKINNTIYNNAYTNNGKFYNYLNSLIKNRKKKPGIYYHFLKFQHAKNVIKADGGEIQLSSLSHYEELDPFEYSAFIRRYDNLDNINEKGIQEIKDKYFIFCLTDSFRNDFMWDSFRNSDDKIALGLRFSNFTEKKELEKYFDLKDVYYDSGFDFEFLNEIQYYLKKKMNKCLKFSSLYKFSLFYKRDKFRSEKEIRLCFDYNTDEEIKNIYARAGETLTFGIDLSKMFPIKTVDGRLHIAIPLRNEFFSIEITDIICGKNISQDQFDELNSIKNDQVKLWYRN